MVLSAGPVLPSAWRGTVRIDQRVISVPAVIEDSTLNRARITPSSVATVNGVSSITKLIGLGHYIHSLRCLIIDRLDGAPSAGGAKHI
jgi:hypothetical protein